MDLNVEIPEAGGNPVDLLASASGLSKSRIKLVMTRGAVWLTRSGKRRRLRRAKSSLNAGDQLSLWYNESIIDAVPPEPEQLEDAGAWSVWFKPAGLLSSGSRYGDHCAINRWVELNEDRPFFLVHRLDAQTEGLMLLAHSKSAAAALSKSFSTRLVEKTYLAEVQGTFGYDAVTVSDSIDGLSAETHIRRLQAGELSSLVECRPVTGRKHQVRIHLAALGHPLSGDHLYGAQRRSRFRLTASRLAFPHPETGVPGVFTLPERLSQFAGHTVNPEGPTR